MSKYCIMNSICAELNKNNCRQRAHLHDRLLLGKGIMEGQGYSMLQACWLNIRQRTHLTQK
jgi:hypothetical protein